MFILYSFFILWNFTILQSDEDPDDPNEDPNDPGEESDDPEEETVRGEDHHTFKDNGQLVLVNGARVSSKFLLWRFFFTVYTMADSL